MSHILIMKYIHFIWSFVIIMPNGGWDQTQAWDEWYHHIQHVMKVQNVHIEDLTFDLVKVKHEVLFLTAHVSLLTNTVPNPISFSCVH